MRIGIDITPLRGRRTGVGYFVAHLLRAMQRLETAAPRMRAWSTGLGPPPAEPLLAWERQVHWPAPTRGMYASWRWTGMPKVDAALGGLDVFHATNYFLPPVRRAARVLSIYDLAFLRKPEWGSPRIVKPFARSVRAAAKSAQAILACSEATRRDVIALLGVEPERVWVTHGAVTPGLFPRTREEVLPRLLDRYGIEPPFFLFVGTLEPRKNLTGLLEAFARVPDLPHRLVLAGGAGWGAEAVEEAIARLRLGGRVLRTGYLPDHRILGDFYAAADALVFPSWYEGFGLPVLEAMHCGCPVITSNTSSLVEIAEGAALLAPPEDTEAIASAMRRVAEDEALRVSLAEAGRARAAVFSWGEAAERTLRAYEQAAACA